MPNMIWFVVSHDGKEIWAGQHGWSTVGNPNRSPTIFRSIGDALDFIRDLPSASKHEAPQAIGYVRLP